MGQAVVPDLVGIVDSHICSGHFRTDLQFVGQTGAVGHEAYLTQNPSQRQRNPLLDQTTPHPVLVIHTASDRFTRVRRRQVQCSLCVELWMEWGPIVSIRSGNALVLHTVEDGRTRTAAGTDHFASTGS